MAYQNEFVQAINETDETIDWDNLHFDPGQRRIVPYLQMCNSYGDPASVSGRHQIVMMGNERGVIQPREVERDRAANYWGVKDPSHHVKWNTIPKMTFLDMDGNKLWTAIEDPNGDHVTQSQMTVQQQVDLTDVIKRQQRQIEQLLEIAGLDKDALPETSTSVTGAPEVPYDDSLSDNTQSPWAHSESDVDVVWPPDPPAVNE